MSACVSPISVPPLSPTHSRTDAVPLASSDRRIRREHVRMGSAPRPRGCRTLLYFVARDQHRRRNLPGNSDSIVFRSARTHLGRFVAVVCPLSTPQVNTGILAITSRVCHHSEITPPAVMDCFLYFYLEIAFRVDKCGGPPFHGESHGVFLEQVSLSSRNPPAYPHRCRGQKNT